MPPFGKKIARKTRFETTGTPKRRGGKMEKRESKA